MSVGSGSRPSTHESQIGVAVESEEIHQELAVVSQVESTDAEARTKHAHAHTEQTQTQDEEESAGIDLIREFDANLHVISDPRCRIAIDRFHPNIRDEVKRAYLLKGPTQPRGHAFPKKIVDVSGQHGLMIMIGWNILFQRVQPIVSIAFYLGEKQSMKSLVMMFLVRLAMIIGRMQQIEDFQSIVGLLMAATTKLENVLLTLVTKGQVSHVSLSPILYIVRRDMRSD